MSTTVSMYIAYLCISIPVTVWVARTLHKNGRRFLIDVFDGDGDLADSTNHLLVVGFYLINLGFVALVLRTGYELTSTRAAVEALASKMGGVLLTLGVMHFFNLAVLSIIRRKAGNRAQEKMMSASRSGAIAVTSAMARAPS